MSVEKLRNNVLEMRKIISDLRKADQALKYSDPKQRKVYLSSADSLFSRLLLVSKAIPSILGEISAVKKLDPETGSTKNIKTESYRYTQDGKSNLVTLNKEDREKFLKDLNLGEESMKKISPKREIAGSEKPSLLAKYSNSIFGSFTERLAIQNFSELKKDLKDSNSRFMLSTYLAIAIFVSLSVFFGSMIFFILLGLAVPSAFVYLWVPFLLTFLSFTFYYFYPSLEKGSIDQKIRNELPFATIYMSAIAGSNIEPTSIFKIISNNPEYKNVAVEMRKVVNQVEVYGYDLVTALRNIAKTTPSEKLSELLGGMATNIVSGGSLKNYLEKKSENLLTDFKLEREKYNSLAATFMDIYISVLITAPLILVMLIVIMTATGFDVGLTPNFLLTSSIVVVALLNIFFLIFLQIKQPK
ncbi:Type II secretion system (T2SS), protein F [uncultured archaeon]|nr:Type II secretion system (T2SS), protein F [uncultured archaeon]